MKKVAVIFALVNISNNYERVTCPEINILMEYMADKVIILFIQFHSTVKAGSLSYSGYHTNLNLPPSQKIKKKKRTGLLNSSHSQSIQCQLTLVKSWTSEIKQNVFAHSVSAFNGCHGNIDLGKSNAFKTIQEKFRDKI